jgi:uncharacterized protein YegP (UPF0339 family)
VTVQIFLGKGAKNWRVRLVASNGRILSVSEGYFSKYNAKRAARRMFPDLPQKEVAQ